MLLKQILQELETSQGPANIADLSRKLGVERSALEGMIAFWVRKGRLTDDYAAAVLGACASDDCGASCSGAQSCPLATRLPRSFSLVPAEDRSNE